MTTTKHKVQYALETAVINIPMTVYFNFTPGAPQTQWQPADPDEVEVYNVEGELLSPAGEIAMIDALNDSTQFFDWLNANRDKTELVA